MGDTWCTVCDDFFNLAQPCEGKAAKTVKPVDPDRYICLEHNHEACPECVESLRSAESKLNDMEEAYREIFELRPVNGMTAAETMRCIVKDRDRLNASLSRANATVDRLSTALHAIAHCDDEPLKVHNSAPEIDRRLAYAMRTADEALKATP